MIQPDFNKMGGLIPAIVQDYKTGDVLMLAYMNQEAWELTNTTRLGTYYSRSRKEIWVKGKTSGHLQHVKEIRIDCDKDAILIKVEQIGGAACHTGYKSCFYRQIDKENVLITEKPVFNPEEVYHK